MYTGFGLKDLISSCELELNLTSLSLLHFLTYFPHWAVVHSVERKRKSDLKMSGNIQSAIKIEIIAIT